MPPISKPDFALLNLPACRQGLERLADGACFEAHELLESVWLLATGDTRRLLQGLIQIAVAWHHWQAGNLRGAQGVLARAHANLAGLETAPLNLPGLLAELDAAAGAIQAGSGRLPPPRIRLSAADAS